MQYKNISVYQVAKIKGFTICEHCDPSSKYVKYKWDGYTWGLNTMKVYNENSKSHVWKKVQGHVTENYVCPCAKCNPDDNSQQKNLDVHHPLGLPSKI